MEKSHELKRACIIPLNKKQKEKQKEVVVAVLCKHILSTVSILLDSCQEAAADVLQNRCS